VYFLWLFLAAILDSHIQVISRVGAFHFKIGLSMTKWRPIEYTYPTTDEAWETEYEHYKNFPEY